MAAVSKHSLKTSEQIHKSYKNLSIINVPNKIMHLITSIVYLPRWIMALQMHAVQFAVCGTLHAKCQLPHVTVHRLPLG